MSYFCYVFILALRLDVVLLLKLKFFFEKWRLPALNITINIIDYVVTDRVPKIRVFIPSWSDWTRFFLQLSPNCLKYLVIPLRCVELWKIIKHEAKKLTKLKKSLYFYQNPFYGWFRVPDPSLGNLFYEVWIKFFQRNS